VIPRWSASNTRAGWGDPVPKEYLVSYDHLVLDTRGGLHRRDLSRHFVAMRRGAGLGGPGLARSRRSGRPLRLPHGQRGPAGVGRRREPGSSRAARALIRSVRRRCRAGHQPGRRAPPPAAGHRRRPPATSSPRVRPRLFRPARCGCGWLFTNPTGRRRWCSMAICGNRAMSPARRATPAIVTRGDRRPPYLT
jgi:hypothetical protein